MGEGAASAFSFVEVMDMFIMDDTAVISSTTPRWSTGIFEKTLVGYAAYLETQGSVVLIDNAPLVEPSPRLAWFPKVVENLDRLPWGTDTWSSESAKPLVDGAVMRLLLLLQRFLPPDGPAPVISPTWDGGVQADWELGDLYLELEVVPDGATRICFVDERGAEMIEEEYDLVGHEDNLRTAMAVVVSAAAGSH